MNCPRCGQNTPVEKSKCVKCAWLLSQAYLGADDSAGTGTLTVTGVPEPIRQYDTSDFHIGPKQNSFWGNGHRRQESRGLREWRKRHPVEVLGNTAVAVMPDEARWAAPPKLEYIQMPLVQSRFDFRPEEEAEQLAAQARAPGRVRLLAAGLDFVLAAKGSALFVGSFALLNGGLAWGRTDLLIYLAATFAITAAYFGFFTMASGMTPGMRWRGLRAVTFEGKPLQFHHRLWRSFGYVVSTGSLLLGFLWAAVDEKRLTWHDYISGTFVTDQDNL